MSRPDKGKVTVFCAWCAKPTEGRSTRKYCGPASTCRVNHWRWRRLKRKAEEAEDKEKGTRE